MAVLRAGYTVASIGELVTVHVAPLADGANFWVTAENSYFTLFKAGGGLVVDGTDNFAPIAGSPIAGAPGAIWARQSTGGTTGGGITSGSFQRLPSLQNTNSVTPVLFWSAPFTLGAAGDVLFSMVWNAFMVNSGGAGTFMGGVFTADVDGTALPDFSGHELNAAATINTEVINGTFQAVAAMLPAGPHTLNIFWQSNDANCTLQVGASEANLQISRVQA